MIHKNIFTRDILNCEFKSDLVIKTVAGFDQVKANKYGDNIYT